MTRSVAKTVNCLARPGFAKAFSPHAESASLCVSERQNWPPAYSIRTAAVATARPPPPLVRAPPARIEPGLSSLCRTTPTQPAAISPRRTNAARDMIPIPLAASRSRHYPAPARPAWLGQHDALDLSSHYEECRPPLDGAAEGHMCLPSWTTPASSHTSREEHRIPCLA